RFRCSRSATAGGNQRRLSRIGTRRFRGRSEVATITINEALLWDKALRERHGELVNLRNENSAAVSRRYGVGGDKEVTRQPVYDVKQLDRLITRLAREIQKLQMAIKSTNAVTPVAGYDQDET